jgi:hypothetical protein
MGVAKRRPSLQALAQGIAMNRLVALAFFALSLMALTASVVALSVVNAWNRRARQFDRGTHALIDEDVRLTSLLKEAEEKGDAEAAARLRAEREGVADRLRQRVRELGQ